MSASRSAIGVQLVLADSWRRSSLGGDVLLVG
jgi:hypothetical protein